MIYLYSVLLYLIVPFAVLHLVWRGFKNRDYWERWRERFGYVTPLPFAERTIWIHAVSVGEVQAAAPLVRALRDRYPRAGILVTTTTPTGCERVAQAFGGAVEHRYIPYDLPDCIHRFLDRIRPSIVVIFETELWPNILRMCRKRSIPVLLANLRLSERSAAGYRWAGKIMRDMLSDVSAVAAQSRGDADRLIALGAPPERIRITGSVKFDVKLRASLQEEGQVLRRHWGVDRGVWIAASTHEGEDEQVLDAFARVLGSNPECLLVLVPRHPERFSRVAALARKRGYSTALRSEMPDTCATVDVFIGDTMGELPVFYAGADVAFVGGSLVPVGGHNMLEPAALGVPIVVGPHVFNFTDIARRLRNDEALRQIRDAKELGEVVVEFLQDANLRHNMGERAKAFVEGNRGALDQVMELVEGLIDGERAASDVR